MKNLILFWEKKSQFSYWLLRLPCIVPAGMVILRVPHYHPKWALPTRQLRPYLRVLLLFLGVSKRVPHLYPQSIALFTATLQCLPGTIFLFRIHFCLSNVTKTLKSLVSFTAVSSCMRIPTVVTKLLSLHDYKLQLFRLSKRSKMFTVDHCVGFYHSNGLQVIPWRWQSNSDHCLGLYLRTCFHQILVINE